MTRIHNRKVEIRFDDAMLQLVDAAATGYGISRSEYIRKSTEGSLCNESTPEASRSACSTLLTPAGYAALVSRAYRLAGGAVGRVQVEACVAATLQSIYNA